MKHLTKLFMENIVILFGVVEIIAVESGSWFKRIFKDMCTSLGIIYQLLVHEDNKGTRVEKYHHFLNKTHAIAGQDRGTHYIFLHNVKTSEYNQNSAPIDGTYILRSVADVGK